MRTGWHIALGVVACVAIALAVTTLWVHQVALNTNRYVATVSRAIQDPEVVAELSNALADQVVEQVNPPRLVAPLIHDWVAEQVARFMSSDAFVAGWEAANRAAHERMVTLLRSEALIDEDLTLDVLPALLVGLQRLQEVGLIPDDIDLASPGTADGVRALVQRVADELGLDIAPTFGQVVLIRAEKLEQARRWVSLFDWITVGAILLAAGLVVLTIWLAKDRWRTAALLGLGAAVAALVAEAAVGAIGGAIVRELGAGGAHQTLGAIMASLIGGLTTALVVLLLVGGAVAVAATVVGRRQPPEVAATD